MVSAIHLPTSGQGVGGEGLLLVIVNEIQIKFSDSLVAPGEA